MKKISIFSLYNPTQYFLFFFHFPLFLATTNFYIKLMSLQQQKANYMTLCNEIWLLLHHTAHSHKRLGTLFLSLKIYLTSLSSFHGKGVIYRIQLWLIYVLQWDNTNVRYQQSIGVHSHFLIMSTKSYP